MMTTFLFSIGLGIGRYLRLYHENTWLHGFSLLFRCALLGAIVAHVEFLQLFNIETLTRSAFLRNPDIQGGRNGWR